MRIFTMVTTAAALWAAAVAQSAEDNGGRLFADPVIVKGQGFEIKRSQLDDAFISLRADLAARGQNIPEDRRPVVEAQVLNDQIFSQIMLSKATSADKTKARDMANRRLEDARKQAGSDDAFVRQLKVLGITPQRFTNQVVEWATTREVVNREVRSKIIIAPEQIQQCYATNDALFRQPETARASHIVIFTRDLQTRLELPDEQKKAKIEKANAALARARKNEDFTKLVEEYSEDNMAKENKGEYIFTRAKDDPRKAMSPEFERAAFALRPGEVSGLVTADYGVHIIKLHEITPAKKTPLTEVTDKIRDVLLGQETERRLPEYYAKLKQDCKVEVLDDKLKAALDRLDKDMRRQP